MPTATKNPFERGTKRYPHLEKARKAKAAKRKKAEREKAREKKREVVLAERELPKVEKEYSKLLVKLTNKSGKFTEAEAQDWDKLSRLGNRIRSLNATIVMNQ